MTLNKDLICDNLKYDFSLDIRDCVTSTNSILKELAIAGAKEGIVVIASKQIAGRGRMGRQFYSPDSSGIYLSLLLRPNIPASEALHLTTLAAVATANAIQSVSKKKALIKWVNDIYIDGKKVCGILAESTLNSDGKHLDYVVLGIGINVTPPTNGFPEDIANIATSIWDNNSNDISKELLISTLLNNFMDGYKNIESKSYVDDYTNKSCILGKEIYVIKGEERLDAIAIEIDDNCRLKVQYTNGDEEWLTYGEISTKIKGM